MAIKAIIFDLWETVGTKNVGISNTLSNKFNIEKTKDFLIKYENAIQLEAWRDQKEMSCNFLKEFSLEATEENIHFVSDLLQEGIDRATMFDGMRELLLELKKNYKLGLLSNTTIFESEVLKKWEVENLFDITVFSWQVKSLKPAKANFDIVVHNLQLLPEECLFIDDGQKNIDAAKEYGLNAIRFENMTQLKESLRELGINP